MAETRENIIQQITKLLRAIPTGKKISFAVVIAMVLGGFIALLIWINRPDYQVLFANLEAADAGQITERLKERKIPFRIKEGGSAILVPDDSVYQLRLELASEGIPKGQSVGFEIFDTIPFGTTEFVQRLKYQQALQGELARTITQFDAIAEARVHIVASGDSLFAEPEKPATASVVVRLHPGRTLDRQQLQGVIHLVACSVEGLKPENVTVVDMAGGLLSKGHHEEDAGVLSRAQFEYQQNLERAFENRILTMLEPVVGLNNVVAKVSAEVDFGQVSIFEERFDPDSSVIRSEQREKETSSGGKTVPIGSPDLKYDIYSSDAGGANLRNTFQKENATINYEINKLNKQMTNAVGSVRRLSAAVIIDGPYGSETTPEGEEVKKFLPRSRREMKTFEDIIKKAIGFSEARGDQVNVSNFPFALQEEEGAFSEKGASWLDYARKVTKPLFNVALVFLFFLLAVRPFKKWLEQAGQHMATRALPQGEEVRKLASPLGDRELIQDSKEQISRITKKNPDAVAEVIRRWISEGK